MKPQPRPVTLRDPAYLKWLRTLTCCWCGRTTRTEAAHHGGGRGVATKAPDDQATPMCPNCHRLSHASFTPRNVDALAARFWAGAPWWGVGNPLTVQSFREWMAMRARELRSAYIAKTR